MRVRFPYRFLQDDFGKKFPLVPCQVRLANVNAPLIWNDSFEAVVDSGAGRCVFAADFAEEIGIDLESGVRDVSLGIGGAQEMWLHDVLLDLPGGAVQIRAAFQQGLPIPGLLGMEGFFEHFIVTFDSLARECQLDRIYRA